MTGRKKNQIFGKYGIVPPVVMESWLELYSDKTITCSSMDSYTSFWSYGIGTFINLGKVNTISYMCTAALSFRQLVYSRSFFQTASI